MPIANKKEEFLSEIQKTVKDIDELLQKSGMLQKDETEEAPAAPEMAAEAPAEAAPAEAAPEMSAEAPEMTEEAPASEEANPEMEQAAEEGDEASLESMAKEMTDEELNTLLEVLQAEQASRAPAQEEAPAEAPAEAAAPAPEMAAPEAAPMDKSLAKSDEKSEEAKHAEKLEKSLSGILGAIDKLTNDFEELKKIQVAVPAAAAPKQVVIVNKPAAGGRNPQALEKSKVSTAKMEPLTKSETQDFLLGQIKQGNKNIATRHMVDLGHCKTDEEVAQFHAAMVSSGVVKEFPKK